MYLESRNLNGFALQPVNLNSFDTDPSLAFVLLK